MRTQEVTVDQKALLRKQVLIYTFQLFHKNQGNI